MQAGLQLYSIKEYTKDDMLGSLKRVAQIGFEGVEFAGYGGISAKDMKRELDNLGLRSIGTHISAERLSKSLEEEIEYNLEIGTKYLILPWAKFDTIDDVKVTSELLNSAAQKVKGTGLVIGYHNHSQEFEKFDDEYILDLLIKNTTDDVVFELDVFWAAYADVKPVEYIERSSKIGIIHIKELKDFASKENTDVGSGVLDFPAIIAAAKAGGAKEFILEQEKTESEMWSSISNGMNYLKTL